MFLCQTTVFNIMYELIRYVTIIQNLTLLKIKMDSTLFVHYLNLITRFTFTALLVGL